METSSLNNKEVAKNIFLNALDACHPSALIAQKVTMDGHKLFINGEDIIFEEGVNTYIIAVGKASRAMAKTLKQINGARADHIFCVTPEEHTTESYCIIASHPIPDQKSIMAAQQLVDFIRNIPAQSLVIFALSGGASALLCEPAVGLNLDQLNRANHLLLKSDAAINEINGVRKHLSNIKGGQLLKHFKPDCTLVDVVISDVPSDDLEVIGSGPSTPDSATFQDAYDTLLRYELWPKVPALIRSHIEKGLTGEVPETLKPGQDPLKNHHAYIIGSAKVFAQKVTKEAQMRGFKTWVAGQPYNQPIEKVAACIENKIKNYVKDENHPQAFIFYGETTVDVTGGGKGGRNQELALRGAMKIEGTKPTVWLSAGTDGIDGPTDAAGAIVDNQTMTKAKEKGLQATDFIRKNDSYHFHEQMGTLLKIGPTGNNLMDVVLILIDPEE